METSTPIWRTPEFWRRLAEEWRGPETYTTCEGICRQLSIGFPNNLMPSELAELLWKFAPSKGSAYFFPVGNSFRHLREELCDKIADHLESCQ